MIPRIASFFLAALALAAVGMAQSRVVIRGGTVINVRDGSLVPNAVVDIEGDRIMSVAQDGSTIPKGDDEIDATGKFLLPGLIDSHVHLREWSMELFLNHGVTTVFDLGNPPEWINAQKRAAEQGTVIGPRVFHGTLNFIGPPDGPNAFIREHQQILNNSEEAFAAMKAATKSGVDLVKTQQGVSVDVLRVIIAEARKANLPVIGHFSEGVSVAIDVGADAVTHMGAINTELVDRPARDEALKRVRRGLRPPASAFMDFNKVPALIQRMIQSHIFINPTIRVGWSGQQVLRNKGFPYEDFDLLLNNWNLRYVPLQYKLMVLKEYQQMGLWHWSDLSEYEQGLFRRSQVNQQRFIKMFADAGGKLLSGVDTIAGAVPGISLHQEMELLVDAGVSPLKALQSATITPAEFIRKQDKLGTLEPGRVGDVIILDANPLEDIRNTRKISQVISRGRVLDGVYHPDFKNPYPYPSWEHSSHYFPSPRILSVSPKTLSEGQSGAKLTVYGTGFIPYSLVRFNGQKLETDFIDESQLAATVPTELLEAGTLFVTVENPDFGWGTTNARGGGDIAHLGIRGPVSNELIVGVRPNEETTIIPPLRETN